MSIEPQTITQAGTHTATVKLRYTPPGAEDLSAELEYPITVNTIYFLRDGAEDPKNRIEHKHSESWLATDPPGLVKEGSSNKSGLMGYTYQPAETDQCNAKYKARFIARAELQYQISWSREHSSHYAEAAVAHFVPISGAEGSPIMGGRAFTSITPVDPHATATLGVSAGVVGTFDFPLNSQPSLSFYGMNTVPMSVPVEMENYEQHSGVHPILYHKSAVANVGAYVRRCADTTRVIAIGTSILTSQAVQGEGDDEFLSVFEFIPVE
ncbi:MAG: hypothetical protein KF722_18415 [Nitrospira sp.]|nr:hypothetical protein [Nitrospira sp.]